MAREDVRDVGYGAPRRPDLTARRERNLGDADLLFEFSPGRRLGKLAGLDKTPRRTPRTTISRLDQQRPAGVVGDYDRHTGRRRSEAQDGPCPTQRNGGDLGDFAPPQGLAQVMPADCSKARSCSARCVSVHPSLAPNTSATWGASTSARARSYNVVGQRRSRTSATVIACS